MTQVTLEDAGARLSQLIADAQGGEEIIITRNSAPVAKIVPLDDTPPRRRPGSARGIIIHMADDFDAPLEDFKESM